METFLDAIGITALILLILIGAAAGWLASRLALGSTALYVSVGILAAVAAPFVLAALGLTALAAGGILFILAVSAVFALVVLAIVGGLRSAARR
jgi:uncharacterized membrane protein YeaQ/YmgE (transglycosylase-associated protein family)